MQTKESLEEQVASRTEELSTAVARLRQEIEDRKQAEEALQASERRFKELIRNSSDSITILDESGIQIYVSDVVEKMIGYPPSELIGIPVIDEMIHPDDRVMVRAAFAKLLQDGEVAVQYRHRHKNGSWVYLEAWGTNQLANPDIRGVVVNVRDISERKQAEEERLALEQQLQHAQKLESLGVLAGGIAHDFNNILAIIMGYSSLIKMDLETAEIHIPEIEKAVERAAALCRQMLAYAGKAPFEKTQVDVCRVVDEMTRMLQSTIAQNVVIKSDMYADVPGVIGDVSQIRQVIMNLIINAAEAIGYDQGEVRVSLSKKMLETGNPEKDYLGKIIPQGCYVCLEVADTGCGMSDETYSRIFEPFYTTKFTGRGLGMPVVLGIVKAHDGALQLSSELGKGTTFKIFLPVQSSVCEGEETVQQVSPEPWQGSGTILLVEDDVHVLLIARTMLQMLGFSVLEATNGRKALQLFQKNVATIDLVVTDMGMPVMDGYELFAELKALRPDLPVIISSGFGDTVVESRLADGDVAGFISKPYSFYQLRDVLKRVVENTALNSACEK